MLQADWCQDVAKVLLGAADEMDRRAAAGEDDRINLTAENAINIAADRIDQTVAGKRALVGSAMYVFNSDAFGLEYDDAIGYHAASAKRFRQGADQVRSLGARLVKEGLAR